MDKQPIPGGSCPILPVQLCAVWAATEEGAVTKLARDVWFTALETQFWRSKSRPGQPYQPSPHAFQISDIAKALGVGERKLRSPLRQLGEVGLLRITDDGPWFPSTLSELSLPEEIIERIRSMFNKLHPNTRDKIIAVPRRILKLIARCGRKTVRMATLLGLLIRIMLEKRTDRYGGHKGCCKAKWIADVFGVGVDRVKTERRQLIRDGWFHEEPTPAHVQKRFGLWLRLNLEPSPSQPKSVDKLESLQTPPCKVEPDSCPKPLKLQPLFNPSLPSHEGISNNQKLPVSSPEPGAYQSQHPTGPTWTNIQPEDLSDDTQSEKLRQDATQQGHLRPTEADQINFFAAIAHALRVATTNPCGLLRTVVENQRWQVISQVDEFNGIARLRRMSEGDKAQEAQGIPGDLFRTMDANGAGLGDEQPIELSEDALIVQTITADFERAGVTDNRFALVQRHGYLQDWHQERWEQAELELVQARLLRARQWHERPTMAGIQDLIEEGANEDELFLD